jgi:RHS repeat-associated protein
LARTYFTHNRIVLLIFCHPFCIAIQMSPGGPYLPSFGRCGVSVLLTNTGFNFSYYRRLRNLDNVSFAGDFLHSLAPATLMQTGWQYNTSNQLTSTPSVTYTYDNNGNTLTKVDSGGTTSYAWDIENRLATVTLPGAGGIVSFMYDPFGRRIQKSSAAGTTNYVYDGTNIVAEFDATGTLVARYSQGQGIDQPLAVVRQGTAAYYNADGLGSITSLRDVNGSVVATYGYDAFGNTTAASSINNPFQYTGREWDSETGLYYYRARYYEPGSGRFSSQDPTRFGGGNNFYAYTINNPINFVDPTGLLAELYCDKIGSSRGGSKNSIFLFLANPTHCYLRVACRGKDVYLELYGPAAGGLNGIPHNDSPFNQTRADNSTKHPLSAPAGMKCCEFEDRLMDAYDYQSKHLDFYEGTGPNSNTFVSDTIKRAGGTAQFPPNAYGAVDFFDALSANSIVQALTSTIGGMHW